MSRNSIYGFAQKQWFCDLKNHLYHTASNVVNDTCERSRILIEMSPLLNNSLEVSPVLIE